MRVQTQVKALANTPANTSAKTVEEVYKAVFKELDATTEGKALINEADALAKDLGKDLSKMLNDISETLTNKIFAKLSTLQANNLIAELGTNPTLKAAMEADEIVVEAWKKVDDTNKPTKLAKLRKSKTGYVNALKRMTIYEKSRGGSGVVKYYRVQGGGTGTSTSRELLEVTPANNLVFTDKTIDLYISTDNVDHANYYLKNNRKGGLIIEFEVPKWLDDEMKLDALPQEVSGSKPSLVDYNQTGHPFGINTYWQNKIEADYIRGSAKILK